MEFSIENWLEEITVKIKNEFGENVEFIGLQGSYKRQEASNTSDIDIVVILKNLKIDDLLRYRLLVESMPYNEKACGFIAGKKEILNWAKSDLFQFYFDTLPLYGNIDYLLPLIDKQAISASVKISAGNIYHMACHNFIYEKSTELLANLYKGAFFILQAKYFLDNNQYMVSKKALQPFLKGLDREIIDLGLDKKIFNSLENNTFKDMSEKLIVWSSGLLQN